MIHLAIYIIALVIVTVASLFALAALLGVLGAAGRGTAKVVEEDLLHPVGWFYDAWHNKNTPARERFAASLAMGCIVWFVAAWAVRIF